MDVVAEYLVYAGGGAFGVERRIFRIDALHHGGDVEVYHRDAEGAPRARCGRGLRPETGRVGHAVVEIPVEVIRAPSALEMLPLTGHAVVFRVRHGVKRLGKAVPALAERRALGGDGEVHPVPGRAVYAVRLHKVETALRCAQPFLARAVYMAEIREDPAAAPLHPHAFICGIYFALAIETGVYAAIDRVHAVFEPEINTVFQLGLYPASRVFQFLLIHRKRPFPIRRYKQTR